MGVSKEELLSKVSAVSGISYQSLKRDLESGNVTVPKREKTVVVETPQTLKSDMLSTAERVVLWAVIGKKPYANSSEVSNLYFSDGCREKICEAIIFLGITDVTKLQSVVGEEGLAELNEILSAGDTVIKEQEARYYLDCFKVVRKSNLLEDLKKLNELYKNEIDETAKLKLTVLIAEKTTEISKI